jgi:NADPH:quinone reductase
VVISAVGTRVVEFDLVDFYHNETRLLGCDRLRRRSARRNPL